MKPAIAILLALSMSACVIEEGGDDPDWTEEESGGGGSSSTYSNHVKLECNGDVLVDRTFTSRPECQSFASSNTFYCFGAVMPIGC